MSPTRAWHIILMSNQSGKPCCAHMSQSERAAVPATATSAAAYVEGIARQGDDKDQEIAWLRATMLLAVNNLTDFLIDNTEEAFEEQPEVDCARSLLQEAGEFDNSFDPFRQT